MNNPQKVLLLVGSPKGHKSTSASLGSYLAARLGDNGFHSETIHLNKFLKTPQKRAALLTAVGSADLILLAFPLYVDSPPCLVIRALESIATDFAEKQNRPQPILVAMVNCGFPEARHCQTALAICRQFARETGWVWAGGLALGGGGVVDGRPLGKLKGRARNVIRSLEMTAEALVQGQPVPEKAVALMARPLVPAWLYCFIATLRFKRTARRCGTAGDLRRRPFTVRP